MKYIRYSVIAAILATTGCLRTEDSASLNALSPTRPVGMGCSACHPYALQDRNHFTHLIYNAKEYVKKANGYVTCLDCHSTSLQYTTGVEFDSVYRDSNGAIWSSLDLRGTATVLPGILVRVDTLVQHHPIPLNGNPPKEGELQEWVTGLAHMNGRVDVVFDSTANDPARYHGARAEFNPKSESCSAVSCHINDGAYRFEACSKGFPELAGGSGPDYQCENKP